MNETERLLEEVMKSPMAEKYVTISWCPADVKELYPHWSDEKCMEALGEVGGALEDRSIELGWEVLEVLLDMQYGNEETLDNEEEM